jgi:hypothetical protein
MKFSTVPELNMISSIALVALCCFIKESQPP